MDSRIEVGLIGYPLSHSLSPYIHNSAFKFLKMNWNYSLYEIKPEEFDQKIKEIKEKLFGFNVTIPYKQKIIKHLNNLDEEAEKIGAVNTVKKEGGKFKGFNTDVLGFVKDLKKNGFSIEEKKAIVFGAGGAGSAVCFGLLKEEIERIYLYDIDEEKAKELKKRVEIYYPEKIFILRETEIYKKLEEVDLIVNSTPCGMKEGDSTPFDLSLIQNCKNNVFVYDVIYNRETELLKEAKNRNLKAISGFGMLLEQAVIAWEIWTEKKAPYEVMKETLLKKLSNL